MAIYSLRSSEVARREGCERDGDPGHPLDFCIEVFLRSIAKKIINERQQCVGHPISELALSTPLISPCSPARSLLVSRW